MQSRNGAIVFTEMGERNKSNFKKSWNIFFLNIPCKTCRQTEIKNGKNMVPYHVCRSNIPWLSEKAKNSILTGSAVFILRSQKKNRISFFSTYNSFSLFSPSFFKRAISCLSLFLRLKKKKDQFGSAVATRCTHSPVCSSSSFLFCLSWSLDSFP